MPRARLPLVLPATCWLVTLAERTALEVGHRHLRVHAVSDTAAEGRGSAAKATGKGGHEPVGQEASPTASPTSVPELKRALQDAAAPVRKRAAVAIGRGGPAAVGQAVPELKRALRDAAGPVRRKAAWAIGQGGPEAVGQAVPELKRALRDEDEAVRRVAAWAIGHGGPEAVGQAVPELKRALQDAAEPVRQRAAEAIGEGGPAAVHGGQAVPELKRALLQDAAAPVRQMAAWAIGAGGPSAVSQAVPELKRALRDEAEPVRRKAARAIMIGGPAAVGQAVPELKRALQDAAEPVRRNAAEAIGKGGPAAVGQAVPELKRALRDAAELVRQMAAWAIGEGGPAAVGQAVPELNRLLLEKGGVQTRAAEACRVGGADVVKDAAAHLQALLDTSSNASTRETAASAIGLLGQSAIEETLPSLRKMLGEIPSRRVNPWADQRIPAAAARALGQGEASSALIDTIPDLSHALFALKDNYMDLRDDSAIRDVQMTLINFVEKAEGICTDIYRRQVGESLPVGRWSVNATTGYMLMPGPRGNGTQAHRCPNAVACPGEMINTTYAVDTLTNSRSHGSPQPDTCPLARQSDGARSGKRDGPCAAGYDRRVAGCAGCLDAWGRSRTDPFQCQKCGIAELQWAVWLSHPAALLALSMRSADTVATRGDAAAFGNDMLKILLSSSANSAVVVSAVASTSIFRSLSERAQDMLRWSGTVTQSGEAAHSSSPDCLLGLGRALSLSELLGVSLANPIIVLAVATPVLGVICRLRAASFTEGLLTLAVVGGNLFLPAIAATCAQILPCFHTQHDAAGGASLMAFSVSEECGDRWSYAPARVLLLPLALAAGPGLWRWLLRKREGGHFLGFLTASYHPSHRAWEANRLTKNMAMATIVAASPVTYCSGQLLTIAVCIMFFYTAYHIRTFPYKLNVLNYIETVSLMVLTTSMALSGLIVSPAWYITPSFGRALVYVVFTLLLTNVLFLMAVWAWAKFALTNDHSIFTDSA